MPKSDKANTFTSMWVVKIIQDEINLLLKSTLQAATNWYTTTEGHYCPLWESKLDHSQNLAMLQKSWANVMCRDPEVAEGE
jgi:hypothetical protein